MSIFISKLFIASEHQKLDDLREEEELLKYAVG